MNGVRSWLPLRAFGCRLPHSAEVGINEPYQRAIQGSGFSLLFPTHLLSSLGLLGFIQFYSSYFGLFIACAFCA